MNFTSHRNRKLLKVILYINIDVITGRLAKIVEMLSKRETVEIVGKKGFRNDLSEAQQKRKEKKSFLTKVTESTEKFKKKIIMDYSEGKIPCIKGLVISLADIKTGGLVLACIISVYLFVIFLKSKTGGILYDLIRSSIIIMLYECKQNFIIGMLLVVLCKILKFLIIRYNALPFLLPIATEWIKIYNDIFPFLPYPVIQLISIILFLVKFQLGLLFIFTVISALLHFRELIKIPIKMILRFLLGKSFYYSPRFYCRFLHQSKNDYVIFDPYRKIIQDIYIRFSIYRFKLDRYALEYLISLIIYPIIIIREEIFISLLGLFYIFFKLFIYVSDTSFLEIKNRISFLVDDDKIRHQLIILNEYNIYIYMLFNISGLAVDDIITDEDLVEYVSCCLIRDKCPRYPNFFYFKNDIGRQPAANGYNWRDNVIIYKEILGGKGS
jgi:hypothetical protein